MADSTALLDGLPVRNGHRPADDQASPDDPGARGSLLIKDRAVQRIAEAAALQVPGVVTSAHSTGAVSAALGRGYPRVDCDVAGGRVRADVAVVAQWPAPAPEVAAQVRTAVTEQLQQLAGLRVDSVDVTVAKVVRLAAPPHRRVQ